MKALTLRPPNLERYLRLTRLDEPWDLGFLAALGLAANWLAAGGVPPGGLLLAYLLGGLAIRCAAWVFFDVAEARFFPDSGQSRVARGLVEMQTAIRLFAALCALAFLSAILLGRYVVLFSPLVWGLVVVFPYARRYSFLSPIVLALGFAWAVPMAWLAHGKAPETVAWLLFVFAAMWATAFLTLYALPHRPRERQVGVRSLTGLVGEGTPVLIGLLQAGALAAAAMAGHRAELGPLFEFGWLAATGVAIYQLLLLARGHPHAAVRAYRSNLWLGVALFTGIAAHYVCAVTKSM